MLSTVYLMALDMEHAFLTHTFLVVIFYKKYSATQAKMIKKQHTMIWP
jgi:hypothetical protein